MKDDCVDLREVLQRAGAFVLPGGYFFHRLLKQAFECRGFRVLSVEKEQLHHIWIIRIRLNSAPKASKYLPEFKRWKEGKEPIESRFRKLIRRLCREWGHPVESDTIQVIRSGKSVKVVLIWPVGSPGRLERDEIPGKAFQLLIRPWLRQLRN